MKRFVDLTHFIEQGMPVWPGVSQPVIKEVMTIEKEMVSVQSIQFSTHLGTHLDAPSHIFKGGKTLDQISLETLIGKAVILDFTHKGQNGLITVEDFQKSEAGVVPGARILLKTGWDRHFGSELFFSSFPHLTLEAAQFLASRRIILLGMDTPSPSPVDDPDHLIHKMLLGAGIVLLESLKNLARIQKDECELIALPAPFKGFSGAPCRVVAIESL